MESLLVFVAGTKGGTGKTTIIKFLTTWYRENGIDPLLIDADDESATLRRFFPEAITIEPQRRKAYDVVMDIVERQQHPLMLWDLKAGARLDLAAWWADVPFEELKALKVRILCIGTVTSSPDSVSSFLRWVHFLGKRVQYLVVKNLKDSDSYGQNPEDVILPDYDATKEALEFRRLYKPATIVLPAIDPEYQTEMERLNLTIRDVLAKHPNTPPALDSMMVRSKLRNFQVRLYEAFSKHKELLLP